MFGWLNDLVDSAWEWLHGKPGTTPTSPPDPAGWTTQRSQLAQQTMPWPPPTEWQDFEPGKAYTTRALKGWVLGPPPLSRRLHGPWRVSHLDTRQRSDYFVYEPSTGLWFYHPRPYHYRDGLYQVDPALVPDEVKDRAFSAWLRRK